MLCTTRVIKVLLTKINVPNEEIDEIVDNIDQKGVSEMFAIQNYDVQETRRIYLKKGKAKGKIEGKIEGIAEGKIEGIAEGKIESAVRMINKMKVTVSDAMDVLGLPAAAQSKITAELDKLGVSYKIKQ